MPDIEAAMTEIIDFSISLTVFPQRR